MISMKSLITEGRYDALVTQLSRLLLGEIKKSFAAKQDPEGFYNGEQIYFRQGETVPEIRDPKFGAIYNDEIENSDIPLDFILELKVQWIEGFNDLFVGGDAFNETSRYSEVVPLIEIRFKLDPADYPKVLSEIAMDLRDTLRHEIEHLTQSGWNVKDSKFIKSDQALRTRIEKGNMPAARYFTLPKEIDAMLQGMYYRAKKTRTPLAQVLDDYLDIFIRTGQITDADKDSIKQVWRERLPQLGIRQEI